MKKKKVNLPKKGAGRKLAAKLKKLGKQRPKKSFLAKLGAAMSLKRKKDGKILKFDRREALVRVPLIANSYISHETVMAANVNKKLGGR